MAGSTRARIDRQQVLDGLRQAVRYRRTAAVLEHRARCVANPGLADLLMARAEVRRRAAERTGSAVAALI